MKDKTYLVLTPQKIEDIFRDLETGINLELLFVEKPLEEYLRSSIKEILEFKKQELLKSIK